MFYVFPDTNSLAQYLAEQLYQRISSQPNIRLGLATGSTMEPVYAQLLRMNQQQHLNLEQIITFNLDEYVGLEPSHPQSYSFYMQQQLFSGLGLNSSQVNLPCGMTANLAAECVEYSNKIKSAGGLDFQLLGIGTNGHIGFNEPGTSFDSRTHVVELSENTRLDNGRFFSDMAEVPTHAITMGILDILEAKEVVLVATGAHKAQVMADLFHSAIDEQMPASALKTHKNLRIYVDPQAASLIPSAALQAI